jgi:hypothetical protein
VPEKRTEFVPFIALGDVHNEAILPDAISKIVDNLLIVPLIDPAVEVLIADWITGPVINPFPRGSGGAPKWRRTLSIHSSSGRMFRMNLLPGYLASSHRYRRGHGVSWRTS